MKWYLNFLEKNNSIKVIISSILLIIIYIVYKYTPYTNILWFSIIPLLYLIPFIITLFVFAWIINPIKSLKSKK